MLIGVMCSLSARESGGDSEDPSSRRPSVFVEGGEGVEWGGDAGGEGLGGRIAYCITPDIVRPPILSGVGPLGSLALTLRLVRGPPRGPEWTRSLAAVPGDALMSDAMSG